jgi:hypothetical protein
MHGCVLHFLKLSVTVICARLRVSTSSRESKHARPDFIQRCSLSPHPHSTGRRPVLFSAVFLSVMRPSARQGHRTPGSSVAASDLCVPAASVRRRSLLGSFDRHQQRFQFPVAFLSHEKILFLLVLCVDYCRNISRLCSSIKKFKVSLF